MKKPKFETQVQSLSDFMTNRSGAQAAQAVSFFVLGAAAFGIWSHFQPKGDKALRDTAEGNTELVARMTRRGHDRWILDNRANVLLAIEQAHYAAYASQGTGAPPGVDGTMVKLPHPRAKPKNEFVAVHGDQPDPQPGAKLVSLELKRKPVKNWLKTKDLSDLEKTVQRSLDEKQQQLAKLQSAVVAQLRKRLHDNPDQELQVNQLEENFQTVQDNLADSKQQAEQSIQAAQRDVATAEQAVNIVNPEGPAVLAEAPSARTVQKASTKKAGAPLKRIAVVHNPKPVTP